MNRADRAHHRQVETLNAAAGMLAERGFHGMSMRELARATGQNLSSLYNDFANKEALLLAIQLRAFEALNHAVGAACQGACGAEEQLFAFIYQHVRYVVDNGAVMKVLVTEAGALGPEQRQQVRTLKERYYHQLQPIVAALAPADASPQQVEHATYHVFGMLNWLYGWYEPRRHGSADDLAQSVYALALVGLRNHCQPPQLAVGARAGMDAPPNLL